MPRSPDEDEEDEDEEDEDEGPPSRFVYKMIQMPPNIIVESGTRLRGQAAAYLERIVNEQARMGWEFFRIDQVGIQVNPGCLAGLFGATSNTLIYYVVTFRKLR